MTQEVMTTDEVMKFIGHTTRGGVNTWCRRYGVVPLYKQSGHKGQNIYLRVEVEHAKASMLGRGVGGGRRKNTKEQKI